MRRSVVVLGLALVVITGTAQAALAQAKGSADAMAAKRVNPHWKAPKNAMTCWRLV